MADPNPYRAANDASAAVQAIPVPTTEPLHKKGGGGTSGGMEGRIARLEAHMEHVLSDTSALKADTSKMKTDLATLTERVAHLPSKGFIVAVTLASLTLVGAISIFGTNIRALFGL
jgi:hypothetical protein